MWQHLNLSDISLGARPRYSLLDDEDVKKPNKQTKQTLSYWKSITWNGGVYVSVWSVNLENVWYFCEFGVESKYKSFWQCRCIIYVFCTLKNLPSCDLHIPKIYFNLEVHGNVFCCARAFLLSFFLSLLLAWYVLVYKLKICWSLKTKLESLFHCF